LNKNDETMKKKVEEVTNKVNTEKTKPIKASKDSLNLNINKEHNKIQKEDSIVNSDFGN